MKSRILDVSALKAVSPAALAAYARCEGWTRTEPYGSHADIYVGDNRPELVFSVLLKGFAPVTIFTSFHRRSTHAR